MATEYVLEQVRINGGLYNLRVKADGDNTDVVYSGQSMTLAAALNEIYARLVSLPSMVDVDEEISNAIDELIAGAPSTYDTLKEIADYIANDQTITNALNAAIVNKVDKVSGKGLSAEDFTTALKNKLESLPVTTATDVANWNAKQDALTFDTTPTENSGNPVTSDGIKTALDAMNATIANGPTSLTFDTTPTANSTNPVTSGGINTALDGKADTSHGTHVTYATTAPIMDGTASVGTAATVARSDHVHPTDTTRAALESPTFTGTPKAPTAAAGTNTTQIATTEFVTTAVTGVSSGAVTSAGKLTNARTISLSGDATGSTTFDGSADASIAVTLASSGATAGSYGPSANASPGSAGTFSVPQVTVDAKGRVTSAVNRTITMPTVYSLTNGVISTSTTTAATPASVKAAYDLANTANVTATSAYAQANNAYNQSNSAYTLANTANATANAKWTAVDATTSVKGITMLVNSVTNTSTAYAATPASVCAAYSRASAAYTQANNAFNAANNAATNAANAQTTADAASMAAAAAQSISRSIRLVQLHHTWSPAYAQFNGSNHFTLQANMKNYHVNTNGWQDIAQQFTTFPDGKICTGRSLNTAPAGIVGANTGGICIENLGNFDKGGDSMTDAQKNTIVKMCAALLKRFGLLASSGITYHAWWTAGGTSLGDYVAGKSCKTCPGTAFFGGNTRAAYDSNLRPLIEAAMKGEVDMTKEEVQVLLDEQRKVLETEIAAVNESFKETLQTAIAAVQTDIQAAKDSIYNSIKISFSAMVENAYDEINPLYISLSEVPAYWRDETQALMDCGAIQGDGVHPISIKREALQAAIIAYRAGKSQQAETENS